MLLAWSMVSHGVDGPEVNKLGGQVLDTWWDPAMPQPMQVSIRILERVPVTSFEDWVHNPEITHHFHQVGLPHHRINQQAMVVLCLKDGGEQLIIVLGPVGQDEVAPCIVGALFGFVIVELQGGAAYAVTQVCPCQIVVGVKMIWIHISYIAGGVYRAVSRVCGDRHGTPEVSDKKAKGTPLARIAPSLKSVTHCLKVDLYVFDEI